jgi:deoxyribonucleoside regulator
LRDTGNEKPTMLYEASILYYEHGYSQKEIGAKLGVSRPGVSRMLQKARDMGIVRIEITDPSASGTLMENQLKEIYGLKKAVVIPSDGISNTILLNRLGKAAAKYLDSVIESGMTIGISWGTTMKAVSDNLIDNAANDISIVQLNGALTRAAYNTHASEIIQKMGEYYHSIPYMLPLPAIVEGTDIKSVMISDRHISRTLNLSQESSAAIFTIGSFGNDSALVKAHYFEEDEVLTLIENGAVADICSRIINRDGEICSTELDDRTMGVELADLKMKDYSIAVAGGIDKADAIRASLKGQWFNVLVTDEKVAELLLPNFINN